MTNIPNITESGTMVNVIIPIKWHAKRLSDTYGSGVYKGLE